MANFAVIKDGVVVNVIVAPDLATAETLTESTCVEYTIPVPGSTYADGKFIDAVEEE
jgi:hypothetical protein